MEIYGTFSQKVHIEPKDVIEKLIEKEIGNRYRNRIVERGGKYYHIHEEGAGCHSFDLEEEITEEKYRYVQALQLVLKRLG